MQILRGRTTRITALAISPDSRFVVATGGFGSCHVWDLSDAEPKPRNLSLEEDDEFHRPTFSSVATLNVQIFEYRWRYDLEAGTRVELVFPAKIQSNDAILHPSGDTFKAYSQNRRRLLTARVTGNTVKRVGPGVQVSVDLLMFDPTGAYYLAEDCGYRDDDDGSDEDGIVAWEPYQLRDTASDQVVTTFELPSDSSDFDSYVFAPDGGRLYVFTRHHVTVYACPQGGPPVSDFALPKGCNLNALAVHPGGRMLATVEGQRTVTLRDADTLQPLRSYDFAMPRVTCVAFTPDGTRCVVGNSRGKVLLFDVE